MYNSICILRLTNEWFAFSHLFKCDFIVIFQAVDKHGISALLAAIWEGHTDCVKFMLEKVSSEREIYNRQPIKLSPI